MSQNPFPSPILSASQRLTSPRPSSTPGKVLAPALALLCVAAFNGAFGLYVMQELIFGVPGMEVIADDESESEIVRETARKISSQNSTKWTNTIVNLVISVFIAVAGIMMMRMRMYPVALIGAILSTIPLLTFLGCCGVGQAVGIWAIVVLADQEVRGWFKQAASPLDTNV